MSMTQPPDGLPTYRLLTGIDDAAFCRRVSEAVSLGYKLYGAPAATFNGESIIVAQAIIWPTIESSIALCTTHEQRGLRDVKASAECRIRQCVLANLEDQEPHAPSLT